MENTKENTKVESKGKRKDLRIAMYKNQISNLWLIHKLKEKGIEVTRDSLMNYINGKITSRKACLVVDEALKIISDYAAEKAKEVEEVKEIEVEVLEEEKEEEETKEEN